MSGRKKKNKTGSSPKRSWAERFVTDVVSDPDDNVSLRELASRNKAGVVGLGLSLLQLVGHGLWITVVVVLSQSPDAARQLDSSSPTAWFIVLDLAGSLVLTGIALFVCLFYGLRKSPRLPAVIGFFLSFFTGVLATALVFMQAIRAMSR
ncbi:MAG: hypothetical protein JNM43_08620 [Planctomycetaceae bacterium]|nr:hypothetical protein [Planctomycetaceae bacterium]